MKNNITAALLAFAGLAITVHEAHAVSYENGDLFLGFRATGGAGATQTYLINIGQASIYRDALESSSFQLDLGNMGIDLAGIYGATWYDRADLFWGIAGAITPSLSDGLLTDPNNTLYASRAQEEIGTLSIAWTRRSNSAQTTTVSKLQSLSSAYAGGNYEGTLNSNELGIFQSTGDANNWASFQPGGENANPGNVSFAAWNPSIEGNFANGAAGTALDLYRMTPSTTAGLPGSYEGTFTIDESGVITYSVIPEPGAALLVGMSLALIGTLRRHRQTSKN